MSIKDRQFKQASQEILQETLRAGKFPDLIEVESRANATFNERSAGLPRFVHHKVKQGSISDPASYNQTFESIANDLDISFGEVGDYVDEMMSMSHLYQTEKRAVTLSIKRLENRIDKLLDRMDYPSFTQMIVDYFENFNHIDFDGEKDKGIPETDSWVNLESGQALLQSLYIGGTKYDLSGVEYSIQVIQGQTKKGEEIKPLVNAVKDTINESWQYRISSEVNEPIEIEVFMTLPELLESNILSIDLHSPKETEAILFISDDEKSWKELHSVSSYDKLEWRFNASVKAVKIRFRKQEPDFTTGTTFDYLFGATNISLKKEVYASKGHVVSQSYPIDQFTVDKIKLEVDDVIYPNTNIEYYIGFEDEDYIDWHEIKPNHTFDMQQLGQDKMLLAPGVANYGDFKTQNFGLSFHSIGRLHETPLRNRMAVYAGHRMWKLETKSVADNTFSVDYVPTLQDWNRMKNAEVKYVPIESTVGSEEFFLSPQTIQRFSIQVYCEESYDLYNIPFETKAHLQVYVNNSLVKPIVTYSDSGEESYKYNYQFKAGWNRVEVITYAKDKSLFRPNLYFDQFASQVLSSRTTLQEVDMYHLLNNTSKKDIGYFAVDGQEIIVNYNPSQLDATGQGVTYHVEYEYIPSDAKQITNLRFMAVLSRRESDHKATPILNHYKLILE